MRYLKQLVLNRRIANDPSFYIDGSKSNLYVNVSNAVQINGGHTVNLNVDQTVDLSSARYSMIIPHGAQNQRPNNPIKGMLRYNDTSDEVEVYQGNTWRSLRFKEAAQVTQQNLGAGDDNTVYFGPLNPAPPAVTQTGTTWGAQNLLVIVENVLQISGTNYTVVQNPTIPGANYQGFTSSIANTGSSTLYFNRSIGIVSGTSVYNGTLSVITLNYQTAQISPVAAVGSTITVTGMKPKNFNGVFVVTASTNSTVTYNVPGNFAGSSAQGGYVTATNPSAAVYPSVDIRGAAVSVTAGGFAIPNGTTVLSYTVDPDTDALVRITLSQPAMSSIPAGTSITIGDPTNTITDGSYWVYFSSPPPTGKIVTVISGFDL